jgi:hypothetical protein
MEMLEDVAAYLTIAPLVVTLALGLLAARWYAGSRRAPAPIRVRVENRPRR